MKTETDAKLGIQPWNATTDYPLVCEWWRGHGQEPIALSILPPTGAFVTANGERIAIAWLYRTDSPICWIEWFLRDPAKQFDGAIESLVNYLMTTARRQGFRLVYCSVKNDSLVRRLRSLGFEVSEDKTMTNLLRRL